MSGRPTSSTSERTRQKLLHAAEQLFADKGYRAMTLRDVTREASVNIAAVNYHFGSKANLMREAIRNRIEPINHERLKRLDALIESHKPATVPVNAIFDTLIRPLFESDATKTGPNPALILVIGRAFAEPADFMRKLHHDFFQELSRRYLIELKRSCPTLTEETLRYRFFLSISTMLGATINQVILENLLTSKSELPSYDKIVSELVAYVAAGFENT
ncbi:MAG: TetR/AcrR family transcriptional regulator [Opitutaceae bacterium]